MSLAELTRIPKRLFESDTSALRRTKQALANLAQESTPEGMFAEALLGEWQDIEYTLLCETIRRTSFPYSKTELEKVLNPTVDSRQLRRALQGHFCAEYRAFTRNPPVYLAAAEQAFEARVDHLIEKY